CLAAAWAAECGIPRRVLGNGSNLLVRDAGVDGLVIRLRRVLDEVHRDRETIDAGAGASFPGVARRAAGWGLSGLEFAAGVPGTVGGAIVMNAGWHEHEIGNVVEQVRFLDAAGAVTTFDRDACGFGYRTSVFRGRAGVVLETTLALVAEDPETVRSRLERFAASRRENQPTDQPSCGSVFLKPPGDFAGRLIDAAGLKGTRVGGVEVSSRHANFFVNVGGATARDVLELVERVERTVESRFGVKLVREFEVW
ncbi:MAG: UDP-N-acetylmuramate dehydrogenase, partial [Acidobacteriota bacterium]|nr:UDP-N-acetylmuramate dehydrogenase [Acidobacteriota bacterium]